MCVAGSRKSYFSVSDIGDYRCFAVCFCGTQRLTPELLIKKQQGSSKGSEEVWGRRWAMVCGGLRPEG